MSQLLASNTLSINHADVKVDIPIRYSSTLHFTADYYNHINIWERDSHVINYEKQVYKGESGGMT